MFGGTTATGRYAQSIHQRIAKYNESKRQTGTNITQDSDDVTDDESLAFQTQQIPKKRRNIEVKLKGIGESSRGVRQRTKQTLTDDIMSIGNNMEADREARVKQNSIKSRAITELMVNHADWDARN